MKMKMKMKMELSLGASYLLEPLIFWSLASIVYCERLNYIFYTHDIL